MLTRRRLIAISAAMAISPLAGKAHAGPAARLWTGQALGARASIRLDHPDAETIAARVFAEIDRLENILSLYRADSVLARLNRDELLARSPQLRSPMVLRAVDDYLAGLRYPPDFIRNMAAAELMQGAARIG